MFYRRVFILGVKLLMLEYVFFDSGPAGQFTDYLQKHTVVFEEKSEDEMITFKVDEDQDVDFDAIEEIYDDLLEENERLYTKEHKDEFHSVGVLVTLSSGDQVQAEISPNIMNKVMSALNADELAMFIDAITSAVESKDSRSMCERHRDSKNII